MHPPYRTTYVGVRGGFKMLCCIFRIGDWGFGIGQSGGTARAGCHMPAQPLPG